MSGANRTLAISGFASTTDLSEIASKDVVWSELIERLATKPPEAESKTKLRLLKLARFGNTKNPRGKGSYRWNGNVLHVSGIIAEHDAGKVSIDDAAFMLEAAGIEAFFYTTPSHMKEGKGPRWRVMAPLSADTPPEQHTALVDKLNGALDGALAPESWVLTQIMYYGKVAGSIYETRHIEGQFLDLVDGITPIAKREPKTPEPKQPEPTSTDEITVPEWAIAHINGLDPDCDYTAWLDIGMRLHEGTDGGDDGFNVWNAWSAKGTKYPGEDELRAKYETFGNGVGAQATLAGLRQQDKASVAEMGPPLTPEQQDVLGETSRVRFEFIKLRDFAHREPVRYLVEGLIEVGSLFGFIGQRKGGKSYAALDLAFAVAQGRPWAHRAILEPGPVVWIAAEGARSLRIRRGPQWLAHYGDADVRVWPRALNLRREETYKGLVEACRDVRLVVIDSLRRVTPGAKENSSDELADVLAYAEQLALNTGAAVCIIAHAGKSDATTARGSSVIEDQLEAGFSVEKLTGDNDGKFRVTPGFARDEETGTDVAMFFELSPIVPEGLTPGVIVNWDVVPPARTSRRKKGESQWRALVDEAITQLGPTFTRKHVQDKVTQLANERLDSFTESALTKGVNRALDERLNGTNRTLKATATEMRNKVEVAVEFELLPIAGNPDQEIES